MAAGIGGVEGRLRGAVAGRRGTVGSALGHFYAIATRSRSSVTVGLPGFC